MFSFSQNHNKTDLISPRIVHVLHVEPRSLLLTGNETDIHKDNKIMYNEIKFRKKRLIFLLFTFYLLNDMLKIICVLDKQQKT